MKTDTKEKEKFTPLTDFEIEEIIKRNIGKKRVPICDSVIPINHAGCACLTMNGPSVCDGNGPILV